MLTKRAKAYSSSCSLTVSLSFLSPAFRCSSFLECALRPRIAKKQ